jgi:hypothetical protein
LSACFLANILINLQGISNTQRINRLYSEAERTAVENSRSNDFASRFGIRDAPNFLAYADSLRDVTDSLRTEADRLAEISRKYRNRALLHGYFTE